MKRIKYIAKNELYSLFFSPIAWVLMILFFILISTRYIDGLAWLLEMYQTGGPGLEGTQFLTSTFTSDGMSGLYSGVQGNMYLFLPLITMGLISREMSSGTIKLLYSSPLRIREVVLGKYLAVLSFILCLLVLMGVILVPVCAEIFHPDYGQLAASLLGLFMVLASYTAIGLFISSLTAYQIVAAISTFAILGFLLRVGSLWQDIDVIRNITFYMNLGGKSATLMHGLLNLRDIAYFGIIIGGFLLFTMIRIRSGMEYISRWKKAGRYLVVIVVAFVVAYITHKPAVNVYFDATRNEMLTITPPTQAMLTKLNDGELEVTLYGNLFTDYNSVSRVAQNSIAENLWGPYIRFKHDINVKFVYYYDLDTSNFRFKKNPGKSLEEIAKKEADSYRESLDDFLTPAEAGRQINAKAEEYRSFFVLRYKGRSTILRTFADQRFWPSENEISAAINRLIGVPPRISFITDEIERGPFSPRNRDYRHLASQVPLRHSLVNQGYDFDTISLRDKEIPTGLAALMIADPRTPFSPGNLEKINRYIDGGGNLFITCEPDRKEITKPLLDKLGLSLRDGMLIQSSDEFSSDVIFPYLTGSGKKLSPQLDRETDDDILYRGDTLLRVVMPGAGALTYEEKNGFRIYPLLRSDKKLSWNRVAPISNDSLQMKVARRPDDEPGSYATAVRMTRKINGTEQRIIVTSDADFMSKPQLVEGYPNKRYNTGFGFWCFSYFSYGQFPSNTLRPKSIDNGFSITVDNIAIQETIFCWIIPVLIGIIGSVILIRRKRK